LVAHHLGQCSGIGGTAEEGPPQSGFGLSRHRESLPTAVRQGSLIHETRDGTTTAIETRSIRKTRFVLSSSLAPRGAEPVRGDL
jgi:hypothetical protein